MDYRTDTHDHGVAPELGSAGAAPARRRTEPKPTYQRSIFARPEIRELVAEVAHAKATELAGSDQLGTTFMIHQLGEVVNELRGSC